MPTEEARKPDVVQVHKELQGDVMCSLWAQPKQDAARELVEHAAIE
jgi:hypothetical protein